MLNVSVDISNANAGMLDAHTVKAHVHSQRCDVNKGGPHYMKDPSGPDSGTNIFEVSLPFAAGARRQSSGSVIRPYLADYDKGASVVLHDANGERFACCNLVPNLPTLPDSWSATIEANIVHDKSKDLKSSANVSYSMLRKEWYHKPSNNLRIDEHSSYSRQTRLVNSVLDKMIVMHKNDTFKDGICEDHSLNGRMARFITRNGNHTLMSTAEMFAFKGNTPDVYHGVTGAGEYVRGIPCEKWTRNVTMPPFGRDGTTHSYTFEYYFPVSSWMIRRESYHRMLARVVVKSDKGFSGHPILHYYDFVDMIPDVGSMEVFNPCEVYSAAKALAGNCTCGLPGAPAPAPWAAGGGGGKSSAQMAGEMAAVAIVCLILGALASYGATYVWFVKCGGIERHQMKHQQFTDPPGTQLSEI